MSKKGELQTKQPYNAAAKEKILALETLYGFSLNEPVREFTWNKAAELVKSPPQLIEKMLRSRLGVLREANGGDKTALENLGFALESQASLLIEKNNPTKDYAGARGSYKDRY